MKYFLITLISSFWTYSVFANPEVIHHGALRNIMHKGDISPKFDLSSLKGKKNLYALGAVGNLKGEIQIMSSEPLITYVDKKGELKFKKSFDKSATLLVYAQVEKWSDYQIPSQIRTRKQFESYLETKATKHGLDIRKAFPFKLEGVLEMNSWHVINWNEKDKDHTHKKHKESGINKTSKDQDVVMLGFYSQNHIGVFTHHTTSMHIHFVSKDKKVGGHSDNMVLSKGMTLKLPTLLK